MTDPSRLPASPLWLAGLYSPSMAAVGAYVPPPIWFGIFIFCMEVITLGFPIVGIFRTQSLQRETLEAIAEWEKRQALNSADGTIAADGSLKSGSVYSDTYSKTTTLKSGGDITINSFESSKSGMLTMTALENALRTNASPLLQFAALKDFSGENASLLTLQIGEDTGSHLRLPQPTIAVNSSSPLPTSTLVSSPLNFPSFQSIFRPER